MRFVFLTLALAAVVGQASEGFRSFESVAAMRSEVLNLIGSTERRIWLTTDFLTDGDIVTALSIARYRKVDVQVLLGRAKATLSLSRLGYLKSQSIPVFIKTGLFKPNFATMILGDDTCYFMDGELDSSAKYQKFTLSVGTQSEKLAYETAFSQAAHVAIPANPKPIPLVGKPQWSRPQRVAKPSLTIDNSQTGGTDDDGVFHYTRQSSSRPEDIAPNLPKVPIWQERARKIEAHGESTGTK